MRVKIGITGTHCSGKTTLATELSKVLEVPLIHEIAGQFKEEDRQKIGTQHKILLAQIAAEKSHQEFVSDRTVIDNLAYCIWHANKKPEAQANRIKYIMGNIVEDHLRNVPYSLMVHVTERFDLEENGIRNLDEKQQIWIQNNIKAAMVGLDCKYCFPVLHVSGPTQERVDIIIRHLEDWEAIANQFKPKSCIVT